MLSRLVPEQLSFTRAGFQRSTARNSDCTASRRGMPPQHQTTSILRQSGHPQHEDTAPRPAPRFGEVTVEEDGIGFAGDEELEQVLQTIDSHPPSLPPAHSASAASSLALPGAVTGADPAHQPTVFGADGFGVDEAAFGMLAAKRVADAKVPSDGVQRHPMDFSSVAMEDDDVGGAFPAAAAFCAIPKYGLL